MKINSNMQALQASGILQGNEGAFSKSTARLSSGYKLNSSRDDPVGLAISNKMGAKSSSLKKAGINSGNGVSVAQTADGAISEIKDIIHRIKELSIKSANETNTDADRQAMQAEMTQLTEEINHIVGQTEYNGQKLLNGNLGVRGGTYVASVMTSADNVSYESIKLSGADTTVGDEDEPVKAGEPINRMNLHAKIDDSDETYEPDDYDLLFSDGGTSHVNLRIYNSDGSVHADINEGSLEFKELKHTEGSDTWLRSYTWSDGAYSIEVEQKIEIDSSKKAYNISYDVKNTGSGGPIPELDLMMYMDTAYNENDVCEAYYTGNDSISEFGVYKSPDLSGGRFSEILDGLGNVHEGEYPENISIANEALQDSLPFSEKISFGSENRPTVSIQNYSLSRDFSYYNDASNIGGETSGRDKALSLVWSASSVGSEGLSASFSYGVEDITQDENITQYMASHATEIQYDEVEVTSKSIEEAQKDESGTLRVEREKGIPDTGITIENYNNRILEKDGYSFRVAEDDDGTLRIENAQGFPHSIEPDEEGNTDAKFVVDPLGKTITYSDVDGNEIILNYTGNIKKGQTIGLDIVSNNEMVIQVGNTSGQEIPIRIPNLSLDAMGIGELDLSTEKAAKESMGKLDTALEYVSRTASRIGAIQNRFEANISNLNVTDENLTDSYSTLRDTDMAKEMVEYTRLQILTQAGVSILSQANELPQQALTLLQ